MQTSPFRSRTSLLLLSLFLLIPGATLIARESGTREAQPLAKVATDYQFRAFLINNIFNYYTNTGGGSFNRFNSSNEGFEFPKGSNLETTYQDGVLWAGFHKGRATPKAGGSMYRTALQAGRIIVPGTATANPVADNPALSRYRLYRVRPHVNPSTPFDAAMEEELQREEVQFLGRFETVTPRSIYDQYLLDWNEWPAADGAPFTDVNSDGVYSPLADIPGVPGADQTLWYVANDMDSARVSTLSGSPPIGIEMQKTIWGYKRSGPLGNTIFITTKIINRSGAPVDSMRLGIFADADIGDAGDDFTGCDTARDLSYMYNGTRVDGRYGSTAPAVGFALLQGPLVAGATSDTGWQSMLRRPGAKNLRMSAAIMLWGGQIEYADPIQGAGGDAQLYCLMKGLSRVCVPHIDPTTGLASPFLFPGDPATETGWFENPAFAFPGDRRMMFSTGPFTFANGDTQEVIIAHLAARGADRLSSIPLLRAAVDSVRTAFRKIPVFPSPDIRSSVDIVSAQTASIRVTADARPGHARAMSVSLRGPGGVETTRCDLFDDGGHGDGASGDRVFSGSATITRTPDPLGVVVLVTDDQNATYRYDGLIDPIVTAGDITVDGARVFADNLNGDGMANLGEVVRYGVTIQNTGPFTMSGLKVFGGADTLVIASLGPGETHTLTYSAVDPHSYFSLFAPEDFPSPLFPLRYTVSDDRGNVWYPSTSIPVSPLPYLPDYKYVIRSTGRADGHFLLRIIDPAHFKGHRYSVLGVDSIDASRSRGITIVDSTDGRILLRNHAIPDVDGFTMPVTDGFKIARGTVSEHPGRLIAWNIVRGTGHWSSSDATNVLDLEGKEGNIGNAFEHWPSGGVPFERQHSVLITYAGTDSAGMTTNVADTAASFAYRYLQNADLPPARPEFASWIKNPGAGFAYQDYSRSVPFSAWDIDASPPRRLMVGFLENNVAAGLVDGRYWPPRSISTVNNSPASGPREWFFIFDLPYSTTPDPSPQVDIWNTPTQLMWVGYPRRSGSATFTSGDQYRLRAGNAPGAGDSWSFTLNHDEYLPVINSLAQNYPNPFNPGTTIRYTLPLPSRVTLEVFNILGQRVRTLVDGDQYAGTFYVVWDGTNGDGKRVASGVYIYRLQATGLSAPSSTFVETKKMLHLR
jgi:hypothetical protein